MADSSITIGEWRRLHELAALLRRLAPWEWMDESNVFGVQNPDTEEIGFVSVMGHLGEHLAISVYEGWRGLERFVHLLHMSDLGRPEVLLETPQLMLSFERRDAIKSHDSKIIRELGLSFRGASAWPKFRAYQPGFYPWFLNTEHEATQLICALEQTAGVTMRFEQDHSLIGPLNPNRVLVRVPVRKDGKVEWSDQHRTWPGPEILHSPIEMRTDKLTALGELPRAETVLELDYFILPGSTARRGDRPPVTYVLLLTDTTSGNIMGFDLLQATEGLEGMWAEIPERTVDLLITAGQRPGKIHVGRPLIKELLDPFFEGIGVDTEVCASLPATLEAQRSMREFIGLDTQ